jgi:uncharacterized protein YyaL (SSP411 family)
LAAGLVRRRKPGVRAVASAAVALAVAATVLAALTASAAADRQNPLRAAMAELVASYQATNGLIGSTWWQAAVALSTIETYAQTTGDISYDPAIETAFDLNSGTNFENSSDDDTAWWGLAWLQAYQLTHKTRYLAMAETDANYIHEAWDSTCGGGVWWQRNPRSYKNAITNELFLELTAWLHNLIRGDTKYLAWAKAEWSWFDHSGMINSSDLINDGLNNDCKNNNQPTWTYNQGVILAGLAQLYRATGNSALLLEAERLATAAVSHLAAHGVLTEPCTTDACADRFGTSAQSFKGIFVSDLKVLAVTAGTSQFNAFFAAQARSIQARDTDAQHQFGVYWAGPIAGVTPSSQASALEALVASVNLP